VTGAASSWDLQVGSVRVQVDSEGAGPPVVLVHSLLTGPEAFDEVARSLARRHLVHRVSLPGFGRSEPLPLPDPTIDDLADHLAAALAALDAGPATVVLGNGLGGFVVAAMAIRHGAGLGSMILSNSGAAFSPERTAAFATMSSLVTDGGMGAVVDVAVRRIFPEPYLEANPHVIGERRRVLEEVDPTAFAAACRALAATDLRSSLRRIVNRTLVVVGEEDATTPPEMGQELAAGIPDSSIAVIAGCGHCPQLQAPAALLESIEAFVNQGA
jgi:3-oxoadipate enol-lactonase